MNYSGLQVLSFVLLLVGTGAVVASIATDFWSFHHGFAEATGLGSSYRGLWRSCVTIKSPSILSGRSGENVKDCASRFDLDINLSEGKADFKHRNVQNWEVACLGLMGGSAILGVLSLLFSPCCCNRCGACLSLWTLLAALCAAAGVGLFAYQIKSNGERTIDLGIMKVDAGIRDDFGWSFWVAVGGGAAQLAASFGFACARARTHSYSHHI